MKKILLINSIKKDQTVLEKLLNSVFETGNFYFYLLFSKSSLVNFFKKHNWFSKKFFIGPISNSFFWLISLPFLFLFGLFLIFYYKNILKIEKIILFNWPEKIIFSPLARLFKVPAIWIEYPDDDYGNISKNLQRLIRIQANKTKIITFSQETKKNLVGNIGFNRENIEVINPGINIEDFVYQDNIFNNLATGQYLNKNNFTIGFLANLKDAQSLEILLQAVVVCLNIISDVRLIVFCKENERKKISFLAKSMNIENNIWLVNDLEGFKKWFKGLDVFVFNDLTISLNDLEIVLGALANSLPVIGREDVLNDFIINDETGILMANDNSEILAEEIIKLYKNIDLREKMGKDALAFFKNEFTFGRFSKDFLKILS